MAKTESKITIDHETIKNWAEDRGGKPAGVRDTRDDGDPGILRIDFPGQGAEGSLEEISWSEFFDKFEGNNLAFLYQETTANGELSRFFKFVSR